ncbi:MAG: diacylglycerol kinase family lipid kinase [Actinomycetota bacterium]|nr:diacylglycerol kinase family lipid kinase [Actinomycetota bacterium]
MTSVAVVAHSGKSFGGGLGELRELLAREGHGTPLWFEVAKSRLAPKATRKALKAGADLVFVWGGDGTVQRCVDVLAGSGATLAILPAGTANLLATNLEIPKELPAAVAVGLHGVRRPLDTGSVNGEHFAVMAGAGFDALMIKEADGGLKDRIGRAAYLWTGARNLDAVRVKATVELDGRRFFKGRASCVLAGNVGKVLGGIEAFALARPDDGILELGVVTAKNPLQWARTLARVAKGDAEKSPFITVGRGKEIVVRFSKKLPYELDGGARPAARTLRIAVHPASVTVCVPAHPAV